MYVVRSRRLVTPCLFFKHTEMVSKWFSSPNRKLKLKDQTLLRLPSKNKNILYIHLTILRQKKLRASMHFKLNCHCIELSCVDIQSVFSINTKLPTKFGSFTFASTFFKTGLEVLFLSRRKLVFVSLKKIKQNIFWKPNRKWHFLIEKRYLHELIQAFLAANRWIYGGVECDFIWTNEAPHLWLDALKFLL